MASGESTGDGRVATGTTPAPAASSAGATGDPRVADPRVPDPRGPATLEDRPRSAGHRITDARRVVCCGVLGQVVPPSVAADTPHREHDDGPSTSASSRPSATTEEVA